MNCPGCGKMNESDKKFCIYCGNPLLRHQESPNQDAPLTSSSDTTPPGSKLFHVRQNSDGVLIIRGDYQTIFSIMRQAMLDCKGKMKTDDIGQGMLESSWDYGMSVFGLRVIAQFIGMPDGNIQISITGDIKDAIGAKGIAKKKVDEIIKSFLLKNMGLIPAPPHKKKSKPILLAVGILTGILVLCVMTGIAIVALKAYKYSKLTPEQRRELAIRQQQEEARKKDEEEKARIAQEYPYVARFICKIYGYDDRYSPIMVPLKGEYIYVTTDKGTKQYGLQAFGNSQDYRIPLPEKFEVKAYNGNFNAQGFRLILQILNRDGKILYSSEAKYGEWVMASN